MAMTRVQLRAAVSDLVNRPDVDERVNLAINLALKTISQRHDFREMRFTQDEPVGEDDLSVGIPSNQLHVIEARLVNGLMSHPIEIRSKRWFVQRYPNPANSPSAEPYYGYIEGTALYFQAPSNNDYTISFTFSRLLTEMTDDANELENDGLTETVINWAASYVFRSLQQFQEYDRWLIQFERSLTAAVMADRRVTGTVVKSDGHRNSLVPSTHGSPYDPFEPTGINAE